jgi:hypothetical protein
VRSRRGRHPPEGGRRTGSLLRCLARRIVTHPRPRGFREHEPANRTLRTRNRPEPHPPEGRRSGGPDRAGRSPRRAPREADDHRALSGCRPTEVGLRPSDRLERSSRDVQPQKARRPPRAWDALMSFFSPSAYEAAESHLRRVCLTRLVAPPGFLNLSTPCSLYDRPGLFRPGAAHGVFGLLRGFPPPVAEHLSVRLPLVTLRPDAWSRSEDRHRAWLLAYRGSSIRRIRAHIPTPD